MTPWRKVVHALSAYYLGALAGYLLASLAYRHNHVLTEILSELFSQPVMHYLWLLYGFELHGVSPGLAVVVVVNLAFLGFLSGYFLRNDIRYLAGFALVESVISFQSTVFVWAIMSV